MKRLLTALLLAALSFAASAEVWQARYGVAETFNFKLYNSDGTLDVDEADGGTEVSLSCNEGAETTATNDFVDEGTFYSIALTAAEMQCERVAVVVAATVTEVFFIQTIDNASAMTPNIVQTGDSYARLGAPAGASIAADLVTIDNFVDDLETRLGTPTDFGSGTSTVAANLQDLADDGTAVYSRTTDSLQAIRDRGDAAWVTGGGGACTADVGCIADGTAQAATGTTIQLASAETFADDELIGATVVVASATAGTGQSRVITDYAGATDTATVDTWTTTPTGTITYRVFGTPPGSSTSPAPANLVQLSGDATAADNAELFFDGTGYAGTNNTIPTVTSVTNGVTLATGAVTAAAIATGAIDADAIATDAIGAAEIAAAAITNTEFTATGTGLSAIPWNAAWDAEVQSEAADAINADTGDTFTAVPWNAAWDAEAQSEAEDAINVRLEQMTRADAAVVNCEVNTANFAGSTTTVACILTDRADAPITAASGDLEGRELLILSGAQIYEGRFINDTTWDGVNGELQLTLSRALPGTLADAVTAVIR